MITIELPLELKRLIEKAKAQYHIDGSDDVILKRVIPELGDEDIIRLYNELCEEEAKQINLKMGNRPNFEKYREEMLDYLDDSVVKAEIIKREQRQSSKSDLTQRNYTYISEFATTLDNKPDKLKIIQSFYRKIRQLEKERSLLEVQGAINNIQLSVHIYECIMHIREKMSIDLELYRGPKFKKKYQLKKGQIDIELKKIRRKKLTKQERNQKLQQLFLTQTIKRIQDLQRQMQEIENQKEQEER